MSQLALRDFMLVRRERSSFVIALVSLMIPFAFINNSPLGIFWCIVPTMYIMSWACGVDYKYRADRFLGSLPLSRSALAGSRYVGVVPAWAITFAISLPMWFVLDLFGPGISTSCLPYVAVLSLSVTLASQAVYLGAYYVVGFQNARWMMMFVFAGFAALLGIFGGLSFSTAQGPTAAGDAPLVGLMTGTAGLGAYAAILAAGFGLYAISFVVAAASYRRKEF